MQVSIIIPVYQENNINDTINKIVATKSHIDYEIIVVDADGGTTANLIENKDVITTTSQKGRAHQMNKGFKLAGGEFLLFLHADTVLPNNALELVVKTLEAPSPYSAGAFDVHIDSDNKVIENIAKFVSWKSRFLTQPTGHQAIFVKKDIFENIGGYKEIAFNEDINFIKKLKRKKHKIEILEAPVLTSARRWEDKGLYKTLAKNITLELLYYAGVNPNTLAKYY